MKGVILAGGNGTRLRPNTLVIGKQLLPVFDKPMIFYPLSTLIHAGVNEVLIICKYEEKQNFEKLLGDGHRFGIKISYEIQEKPEGIAQGITLAEDFINGEPFWFILGDNLFHGPDFGKSLSAHISDKGASIFLYKLMDTRAYGVAVFDRSQSKISELVEKPEANISNWAIPGLYHFDGSAPGRVVALKPSERGEFEIIDLLRSYLATDLLTFSKISRGNAWFDLGTAENLLKASMFVEVIQTKQGMLVGSPEEAGFRSGFISYLQLMESLELYSASDYGNILKESLF